MSALKHWKSQEVASYSPANQFFFLFIHAAGQCLLIAVIITVIHPHFTAFFIVSVEKAVLLQHKAVCRRFACAQTSSSDHIQQLSSSVRRRQIIRRRRWQAATLKSLHTKKTWHQHTMTSDLPVYVPFTQIMLNPTHYFNTILFFLVNKVVLQKHFQLDCTNFPDMDEPIIALQNDWWDLQPIKGRIYSKFM